MRVADLDAPPELVSAWSGEMNELTSVQEEAVSAGVLTGDHNLLIVAPTSSGKSLIGEMAASRAAFGGKRHSIFAVPMRSLADEHYLRMKERYRDILSVVISTGDWAEFDDHIRTGSFDVAVMTYEKLAILLVQAPELLERCGCVVIDEAQMISDETRGARLELLITQLLIHPAKPRIVALSASLDELNQLDRWLQAEAIVASQRPVPLDLAVCSAISGTAAVRRDGGEQLQMHLGPGGQDEEQLAVSLALRFIEGGQQVIVFRAKVPDTERMAGVLARSLPAEGIDQELGDGLAQLEDPESARRFRNLLAAGVGFHNGDLAADERRLMEEAFRSRRLSVLVATTTLAMGVNMPADVVIVADHRRFLPGRLGWTSVDIPVAEFRNAAGRAGRLGLKESGFAILAAEDDIKRRQLFSQYIEGEVEPVVSRLPDHPLEDAVFSLLASRLAETREGLIEFMVATYGFVTWYDSHGGVEGVREAVTRAVETTIATGLVLDEGGRLAPTAVGHSLARAGVSLEAAVRLKALLDLLGATDVPRVEVLFELSLIPESGDRPWVPGRPGFPEDPRRVLQLNLEGSSNGGALQRAMEARIIEVKVMQGLLQCACLLDWAAGGEADVLRKKYKGISLHRLGTIGGTCAWLVQALLTAAKAADVPADRVGELRRLSLELTYGLPAELAPLARLRSGIGRAALLQLYGLGVYQPDDILEAEAATLSSALSPGQLERLKLAILQETEATLRRFRTGHVRRATRSGLPPGLFEALYTAKGKGLEQAVEDAINATGLKAVRIMRQPAGEEDIQVSTSAGTVVVSVTASDSDQKPVRWNKAKDVMAQGGGQNPINCACIARPRFEGLAEQQADKIARETGGRSILLIPMPVLAEIVTRVGEGGLSTSEVDLIFAQHRGLLAIEDLPEAAGNVAGTAIQRQNPKF